MVLLLDGAAEGMLHSIAIRQIEQPMHAESGGALSADPHAEVALVVVEGGDFLPEEVGDVPADEGTGPVLAAVHENPLLLGVRMQIDEHEALLLVEDGPLCVVDFRTALLVVVVPHAVQVVPRKTAPVVTVDDAVGVQHGHDLEDEVVSQLLGVV